MPRSIGTQQIFICRDPRWLPCRSAVANFCRCSGCSNGVARDAIPTTRCHGRGGLSHTEIYRHVEIFRLTGLGFNSVLPLKFQLMNFSNYFRLKTIEKFLKKSKLQFIAAV